jgi:EAL domain-containing protein (putative c-di-GMP-specific phosphodiesterase class I)
MAVSPFDTPGGPPVTEANIPALLRGLGVAPYVWDIASDRLIWGGDPTGLLHWPASRLATGQAWHRLVMPGSGHGRADLVRNAAESAALAGAPFRGSYAVARPDSSALLLEDTGRWFAAPCGRPARVQGVVRRLGAWTPRESNSSQSNLSAADPLLEAIRRAARAGVDGGLLLLASAVDREPGRVADAIHARLRPVLRRGDILLRASDDRVAVLLSGAGRDELRAAAERLAALLRPVSPTGVAIGAIRIPASECDPVQVLQQATSALLRARMPGHRGVCFHRAGPGVRSGQGLATRDQDKLIEALNDRRITLARRPVLAAGSRSVLFEDAIPVMTGRSGRPAPILPALRALEADGMAALAEHRCLEVALAVLRDEARTTLRLPVSPAALACRSWHDLLAAGLSGQARMARRLIVDLDETSAAVGLPAALKALGFVKEVGARVGISGYGRGLLTTGRVLELGADIVFVDGALLAEAGRSSDMRFLVRSVAQSLHGCGRAVAGDWVADEDTARLAEDLGIDGLSGPAGGAPRLQAAPPAAERLIA